MMLPDSWGSWTWISVSLTIVAVAGLAVILGYAWCAPRLHLPWRLALGLIKWSAIALLAICLLEPQSQLQRAVPKANIVAILADDSRSLQLQDADTSESRAQQLKRKLVDQNQWIQSLQTNFEVRSYLVDQQLHAVNDFQTHQGQAIGSHLYQVVPQLAERLQNRPVAGIVLLTDGNATDDQQAWRDAAAGGQLPPVYPVVVGQQVPPRDLWISQITSSQTNFESAPITISAQLKATGFAGETIAAVLYNEQGKELDRQLVQGVEDNRAFAVRFQTSEFQRGASFFRLATFSTRDEPAFLAQREGVEATWRNNQRWTVVDRGRGPYRALYFAGRPNWDFKFLNRALVDDPELQLVGLLRVADKEAKFTFRGYLEQQSNPLFRGFKNHDEDAAEARDEAVLLRVGVEDTAQLKAGFPQTAAELFDFDAIIIDDVESSFFSETQKSLIQQFVSLRGGALLMLGGADSFAAGGYDKTPIGDLLPVYLDANAAPQSSRYQLELTRDGWLQPWLRLHSTEETENRRLAEMPEFRTLNLATAIKPGATVLSRLRDSEAKMWPGLVTQSFGKGKAAALLIGDLWRWQMQGDATNTDQSDLAKSWRQTVRWLVADVPRFVEVEARPVLTDPDRYRLTVSVRDPEFKPMDNAQVVLQIVGPEQKTFEVRAEPSAEVAGRYETEVFAREPGVWRAIVTVTPDASEALEPREIGWAVEPGGSEFDHLSPNRTWLEEVAQATGGKVYSLAEVDRLAEELPWQRVPVEETYTEPWWHRWPFLVVALSLLVIEWGSRRRLGMP